MEITERLVRRLIARQFPQWAGLPVRAAVPQGHDNRTFRLGEDMAVRLPSAAGYVAHIPWEIFALTHLPPYLPVAIPQCLGQGTPDEDFPFPWTVNRWLPGAAVTHENVPDTALLAADLNRFLRALHEAPVEGAPLAGAENCYRGCHPSVYGAEVQRALAGLEGALPTAEYARIWREGCATCWSQPPVWVHGDVAVGNMLQRHGRLSAMIDFGTCGVSDPACDYVMAWTFFDAHDRQIFLSGVDGQTIARARAWAVWKALITSDTPLSRHVLRAVLETD